MSSEWIDDTIAAIATAPGEAGIGIIRVSGEAARNILKKIFRTQSGKERTDFEDRHMYFGNIYMANGEKIDEVLVVYMKGPHSYTGEDVVEIQCHGGFVAVQEILWRVLNAGARLAEAGEFTKRAFLNGRVDLAQAEAVMDIISAKTGRSLNVAVGQLSGRISGVIKSILEELIGLIAFIEAAIDFPEHDIEELTEERIRVGIEQILGKIDRLREGFFEGKLIRDGIKIAIVGRPNVGKSSLMNALLNEERAIVTHVPGTTRDIIEESLNVDGILVRLLDTAGIRETDDLVESIGVNRTRDVIESSNLILFVLDTSVNPTEEDLELLRELEGKKVILVLNKSDQPMAPGMEIFVAERQEQEKIILSAKEETGIQDLEQAIRGIVTSGLASSNGNMPITNGRHRELIEKAYNSINSGLSELQLGVPLDLVSLDLRDCWSHLGMITGDSIMKDVAAEIFTRFCIGK